MKMSTFNLKIRSWLKAWLYLFLIALLSSNIGCDSKSKPAPQSVEPDLKASISESIVPLFGENPLPPTPQSILNLPTSDPTRVRYDLSNEAYANMQFPKAVDELSKTIEFYSSSHPEDKTGIAQLYQRLGAFSLRFNYLDLNKRDKAASALKEAISIFSAIQNKETEIATCYYYLGRDSTLRLSSGEALSYYLKAMEILKNVHHENIAIAASIYRGIADVYMDSQPLDASLNLDSALKIVETRMGKGHPDVARIYLDIGYAQKMQGYNDKALAYYQKSLQYFDKFYGSNSVEAAETYFLIGDVYYKIASLNNKTQPMDIAIENYLIAYKTFSKLPEFSLRASMIKEFLEKIYKSREPNGDFTNWLKAEMSKLATK